MKKRPKCELIPVLEYDGKPQRVVFEENSTHTYYESKHNKEHYLRASRKTCSECAKTALYVGIFKYKKHIRVERFCRDHAAAVASFGELPQPHPQPEPAIPDLEIK
jgi:hypothetical protein